MKNTKGIWARKRKDEIVLEVLTDAGNEQFILSLKEATELSIMLEGIIKRINRSKQTS